MIEPNNGKTFICVRFCTADEKLCEYEKIFGEKPKSRDKLIQSGTPGQHTETVQAKPEQLEYLSQSSKLFKRFLKIIVLAYI